jgi:hypothetical protein
MGGAEVEEYEAEGKEKIGRRQKWRRGKRNGRQERGELLVREVPVIAAEKTQNSLCTSGYQIKENSTDRPCSTHGKLNVYRF